MFFETQQRKAAGLVYIGPGWLADTLQVHHLAPLLERVEATAFGRRRFINATIFQHLYAILTRGHKTQRYSYMRRAKCLPAIQTENGAGMHAA
jgi:hypothetical protein